MLHRLLNFGATCSLGRRPILFPVVSLWSDLILSSTDTDSVGLRRKFEMEDGPKNF